MPASCQDVVVERDILAAEHFARHGYVAVVQDMRGRYASEGEFTKYAVVETEDGFDMNVSDALIQAAIATVGIPAS